jgi:hypothetical protein
MRKYGCLLLNHALMAQPIWMEICTKAGLKYSMVFIQGFFIRADEIAGGSLKFIYSYSYKLVRPSIRALLISSLFIPVK